MPLTPDERSSAPISERAWGVVQGTIPVPREGTTDIDDFTNLLYVWYRAWLAHITEARVEWYGRPLHADFTWVSAGIFHGRQVTDLAEELESDMLEAAGRAVDEHRPEKGPLVAWVRRRVISKLNTKLDEWKATANMNEDELWHLSLDKMLEDEANETPIFTPRRRREYQQAFTTPEPELEDDEDRTPEQDMAEAALNALDETEQRALVLYADHHTFENIAEVMGLSGRAQAYKIVQRARAKAQEALLDGS
jgi:RNA polymerase sigma factor (sigma-70 family)